MIPIGLFVVAAAWLFGRTIAAQALRPLVETTASLSRFGDGDFTPRPVFTADRNEIGALAEAYNRAAAQVSAAFEERRAAELQMRQFVADAGHELRTPLTVIMGFIDVLRRRATHETGISTKIYETMLAESRRMKALIDKLIVLARLENQAIRTPVTLDIAGVAGEVVAALQVLAPRPRIALDAAQGVFVRADEHEFRDALSNLVENALKYAPESPVEVRVAVEGSQAVVEVADRGPGIPADEQQLVFDRFYRGRDRADAEGCGLGLAIARRAIERAGGRLSVVSALGSGSRFTIVLPRSAHGEDAALAV
jgi:two-component system OmpR family sensor kinase